VKKLKYWKKYLEVKKRFHLEKGFQRFTCRCGNWVDVKKKLIPQLVATRTIIQCPQCFRYIVRF